MNEQSSSSRLTRETWRAGLVLLVAFGLRLAAARGELSFDEFWSWELAANAQQGVVEILLLRLDNNHILNTLVMYALGPLADPFVYRLPAVFAGCAGLVFGYLLGRRRQAGLPVLTLLGLSHLMILYGSEARGYAYLTGCTLAAWWFLERFLDQPQLWSRLGFAATCSLGFLAQLPFAFAYAGFFAYSALRCYGSRHWIQMLIRLHLWPCAMIVAVYFFYIDGLNQGGGDSSPVIPTLIATLSLIGGGPQVLPAGLLAAVPTALILLTALIAEFRRDFRRGLLYLTVMVLAPAGVIMASGFAYVYPRHFLVPAIFGYVLVGCHLAQWWQNRAGKLAVILILTAFCCANGIPVQRLIAHGRNQDAAAFQYIVDNSDNPQITIAGDHDFRVSFSLAYFQMRQGANLHKQGTQITYLEQAKYPETGAEWTIIHQSSPQERNPPPRIVDRFQHAYQLQQMFPSTSLSGFQWWVYRRVPAATDD